MYLILPVLLSPPERSSTVCICQMHKNTFTSTLFNRCCMKEDRSKEASKGKPLASCKEAVKKEGDDWISEESEQRRYHRSPGLTRPSSKLISGVLVGNVVPTVIVIRLSRKQFAVEKEVINHNGNTRNKFVLHFFKLEIWETDFAKKTKTGNGLRKTPGALTSGSCDVILLWRKFFRLLNAAFFEIVESCKTQIVSGKNDNMVREIFINLAFCPE